MGTVFKLDCWNVFKSKHNWKKFSNKKFASVFEQNLKKCWRLINEYFQQNLTIIFQQKVDNCFFFCTAATSSKDFYVWESVVIAQFF